jgi:DNA-directed RNA polymerase specialized sigma24 family protein
MEISKTIAGRIGPDAESDLSGSARTRRKWTLTGNAFDSLLASLDEDRDSAAEKYLEIRRNLVRFFEWRGCSFPDDHADETLNRVAKKIEAGEEVRNPAGYAVGVARLLLLEIIKDRAREERALKETANVQESGNDVADSEERLECLRGCLQHLSPDNRDLIIQYYQGDKGEKIQNRRGLLSRLGIPVNTLRMRALRLREKLQICVEECLTN